MSRDGTLRGPVFYFLGDFVSRVKHFLFLRNFLTSLDMHVSDMYHALTLEAA